MSDEDEVTVRLTEDGPLRIRGGGRTWERGETRTVDAEHAEALTQADHFEVVDGAAADEFDVAAFVDRTPMDVVIEEIEAGEADDYLETVADEASRQGVLDAVESRQAELAESEDQEAG